uniref:Uncharacterized protein n=1 Tax=Sphaerodactylus townsendi TaxID=933632 RepID=A0ACB8G3T8_9SAUR
MQILPSLFQLGYLPIICAQRSLFSSPSPKAQGSTKLLRLDDCSLLTPTFDDLASALSSNQTLTELNLNNNELGDSGVEKLCKGLMNSSCKLEKLWLQNCNPELGTCCRESPFCDRAKPSLTDPHTGDNRLGTSGAKVLCEGLLDPNCQLQKLHLDYCELSARNAEDLSSVLHTKTSLIELNLSNNKLGDAAVKQLCGGLLDSNCKMQSLQLENCRITAGSCGDLGTVLSTKPSLRELCIGENKIGDAGAALLCQGVLNPNCKVEKLWLWECDFSAASCKDLANVIRTKESLKEMSLIGNDLKDEGMEHLCEGLKDPKAAIQSLWLRECGLTKACCKSVASVLSKNNSLKELQIGGNNLQDEGVAQICEGLMDPSCTLESIWLGNSELTSACCDKLATIIATSQCLTELEVSNNELKDKGVRKLCEAVRNPNCRLQQLILYDIFWSTKIDDELKALEESKPGFKAIF